MHRIANYSNPGEEICKFVVCLCINTILHIRTLDVMYDAGSVRGKPTYVK